MRLKRGANETIAIAALAVMAVICAGLLAAWQAGFFDDSTEQLESNLQREKGSMVSPGDCDGSVAATMQNVWARPDSTDQSVTGPPRSVKRVQISAELDEGVYGMDFNADGDTKDVIPRLPDISSANISDREWLETPGGVVVGSKYFGRADFGARISERSIPLFSYRDLLYHSAASTDLRKLRDVSRNNNHIGYFWNIREAALLDRLAPANPVVPSEHREPPALPAVAVPLVNVNGNPIAAELSFNAQIVVDKQAGCWTIKYNRPLEIQCVDGTDACFTGHSWEYLTSVFTGDVSIVFRYPNPELNIGINNPPNFTPQPVDLAGRATEAGETVTCGAISAALSTNITVSKVSGHPCRYAILPTSAAKGGNTVQIHFTSTSGAERTIDLPVHVSNIQYTSPPPFDVVQGGQATVTLAPTDGIFAVTCYDPSWSPADVTITRSGCEYTLTASASARIGTNGFRARIDSAGGHSIPGTQVLFNVVAPPSPPPPSSSTTTAAPTPTLAPSTPSSTSSTTTAPTTVAPPAPRYERTTGLTIPPTSSGTITLSHSVDQIVECGYPSSITHRPSRLETARVLVTVVLSEGRCEYTITPLADIGLEIPADYAFASEVRRVGQTNTDREILRFTIS